MLAAYLGEEITMKRLGRNLDFALMSCITPPTSLLRASAAALFGGVKGQVAALDGLCLTCPTSSLS